MKVIITISLLIATATAIATGQDYSGYRYVRQGYGPPGGGSPSYQQPQIAKPHGHGHRQGQQYGSGSGIAFGGSNTGYGSPGGQLGPHSHSSGGFGGGRPGGGHFNAPIQQGGYGGVQQGGGGPGFGAPGGGQFIGGGAPLKQNEFGGAPGGGAQFIGGGAPLKQDGYGGAPGGGQFIGGGAPLKQDGYGGALGSPSVPIKQETFAPGGASIGYGGTPQIGSGGLIGDDYSVPPAGVGLGSDGQGGFGVPEKIPSGGGGTGGYGR